MHCLNVVNIFRRHSCQSDSSRITPQQRRNRHQRHRAILCFNYCPAAMLVIIAAPIKMGEIALSQNLAQYLVSFTNVMWRFNQISVHEILLPYLIILIRGYPIYSRKSALNLLDNPNIQNNMLCRLFKALSGCVLTRINYTTIYFSRTIFLVWTKLPACPTSVWRTWRR